MIQRSEYEYQLIESIANSLKQYKIYLSDTQMYLKLLGIELAFGKVEYGTITHFKGITERKETNFYAVTDKGFEFECEQLMYLLKLIELKAKGIEIVYPEGSDYAQNWTKPKRRRRTSVIDGSSFIHPSQYNYYTNGKKGK
jgi:hypothetical protein